MKESLQAGKLDNVRSQMDREDRLKKSGSTKPIVHEAMVDAEGFETVQSKRGGGGAPRNAAPTPQKEHSSAAGVSSSSVFQANAFFGSFGGRTGDC